MLMNLLRNALKLMYVYVRACMCACVSDMK